MAAYAALVSLMNDLELIPNHPTHSFSFDKKQISSLSETVHFLVDFMESYDTHGCSREAAEILESRIASAAHAAHDVIESHIVDQIHAGSTLGGKTTSYFLLDLQKAIDNMYFVMKKAAQFKERRGSRAEQPKYYSARASSEASKNLMVGFGDDVVRLVEMLTGEPSGQRVIPIVGMGGIGKTTLARNVYGHLLIRQHFDIRLWATISQEYSVETILTQLLSRERKSAADGNVCELGLVLHQNLIGRRYLIVLDDMWSVEAWEAIQIFLPDNGNGSCVVVTTRLSNLAAHLSTSSPFEMNLLGEEKSWELFCGNVFGEEEEEDEDCPVELEEFGKRIVEKCRGLPLSIVVIGGHLRRSSREIEYWEKVANYMNPVSSSVEDDQCLEIISLSYHHLPVYLKPCFLCMGTYPEDQLIDASQLLNCWIAEGFLKAREDMSLEEVGEDYLKDLIDRNLIFVVTRKWDGKVECCVIHDLVRELCLKVAKKLKFMRGIGCTCTERRRITNVNNIWNEEGANFEQVNIRYLAVYYEIKLTTKSLNALLILSETVFLPSSISLLWNMQTIVIEGLCRPMVAPYEIWDMPHLRHLQFANIYLPDPRSNQEERIVLGNLHTLLGVTEFRLTEEVCKRMPNIKNLSLRYIDFHGDCPYYCLANLGRFDRLKSLDCSFSGDCKWRDVVLTLTFPHSLEKLRLSYSYLHWEDLTLLKFESLPYLGSLDLSSVKGSHWDIVGDQFPNLKVLTISGCDDFIYWNANSSHFPMLENLYIVEVPKLKEIPLDIGEIPTLELIHLNNCCVSAVVSAMRIVVEQESFGNQSLELDARFHQLEELERFEDILQQEDLTSNNLRLYHRYDIRLRPSEL